MTVCNDNLGFKFFTKKDVVANFDGGKISSDAGLLLFAEYDRQLGFSAALASHIEDRRDPRHTRHAILWCAPYWTEPIWPERKWKSCGIKS